MLNKKEDINQIAFDCINFNLDSFSNVHLEVSNETFGKDYRFILIKEFKTREDAINYSSTLSADPGAFKNVKEGVKACFVITAENYPILKKQDSIEIYLQFVNAHYQ